MAETSDYTNYEHTLNSAPTEVGQSAEFLATVPFLLGMVTMETSKIIEIQQVGVDTDSYSVETINSSSPEYEFGAIETAAAIALQMEATE